MSDGSNHNDDEAGREEDRLHFPTPESGDTRPTDDHFRSLVDQETYLNLTGETQPHNSPPGLFYSIRLPPSQTANSGYHSIRPPNNAIHFRNYRPHHYSDDPNAGGGAAAAADDDDFGHSDLSESQLGSYDVGMLNLGEVSLGHGNLLDIPVESSLHENVLHSGVNDELYAIGPASLPLGDDSGERDQTCRKSICSVVSEGQEVVDEECHIEQMSLVSVNPPAVESTVSQRGGEQNVVIFENVTEMVPRQAASTSGYQTGTDAEQGRVQPVDNLQTLVKGDNQEPTQHPEQHLQSGPVGDLQVHPHSLQSQGFYPKWHSKRASLERKWMRTVMSTTDSCCLCCSNQQHLGTFLRNLSYGS